MAKLYVIATPIGNLEDFGFRALRILKEVDLILAEDTRKTKILLDKYEINTPLISYHQHTKARKISHIIDQIKLGKDLALVSESGTPGISDPGGKLVSEISKLSEISIIPVPGPNAAVAALSVSGFPADQYLYLGFLPKKKGRRKLLESIKNLQHTIVFYESPYRILKTLNDLKGVLGNREVTVCRELTKRFEEIYRGKISEVLPKIKEKGEFVIVIKGHETDTNNSLKNTKNKVNLLYKKLSYTIQGIAMDLGEQFGSGQKESIYQNAFAEELSRRKILFQREQPIKIYSPKSGKIVGEYKPDFIIDDKIIVELKALPFAPKKLEDQLYAYLRNSKYELGYFFNFGGKKLYRKRIIYTNDRKDFFSGNIVMKGHKEPTNNSLKST